MKPHFWVPGDQPRLSQCENGVHAGVSVLLNQGRAMLPTNRPRRRSEATREAREEREVDERVSVAQGGSSNRSTPPLLIAQPCHIAHPQSRSAVTTTRCSAGPNLLPIELRSRDAIRLASAERVGRDLGQFVTYDQTMTLAAQEMGYKVSSPA